MITEKEYDAINLLSEALQIYMPSTPENGYRFRSGIMELMNLIFAEIGERFYMELYTYRTLKMEDEKEEIQEQQESEETSAR